MDRFGFVMPPGWWEQIVGAIIMIALVITIILI